MTDTDIDEVKDLIQEISILLYGIFHQLDESVDKRDLGTILKTDFTKLRKSLGLKEEIF